MEECGLGQEIAIEKKRGSMKKGIVREKERHKGIKKYEGQKGWGNNKNKE